MSSSSSWQCHAVTGVTFIARALRCEEDDGVTRHTPVIDTILLMTLFIFNVCFFLRNLSDRFKKPFLLMIRVVEFKLIENLSA